MQRIIKLSEAVEFVKNNGYILAVYHLRDGNYHLLSFVLTNHLDPNTNIIVDTMGQGLDFNEFTTEDKEYCFRLHNNFNVPDIIPVFARV